MQTNRIIRGSCLDPICPICACNGQLSERALVRDDVVVVVVVEDNRNEVSPDKAPVQPNPQFTPPLTDSCLNILIQSYLKKMQDFDCDC